MNEGARNVESECVCVQVRERDRESESERKPSSESFYLGFFHPIPGKGSSVERKPDSPILRGIGTNIESHERERTRETERRREREREREIERERERGGRKEGWREESDEELQKAQH